MRSLCPFLLLLPFAAQAQVCDPVRFSGPYAFQIFGTTTISGDPKPATSLGRLIFDGHGKISGTSSTMFAGYLLGNPVTGTYELATDCTLTWKLQDDSGAFQSFSGTISPDLARGQFRQAGFGGPQRGTLTRSSDRCTAQDLKTRYTYTVNGSTTPMVDGDIGQHVAAAGTVDTTRNTSFSVDPDCTVTFDLSVIGEDQLLTTVRMRGQLVNDGREILAIETDPGAMVAARLNAVPQQQQR
jgi:hypothetical protein